MEIRQSPFRNTALLGAAALLLAPGVQAQIFRGSIAGSVTDNSGAAIAGAQVTAMETATGAEHKAPSSGAGEYSFSDLPLGAYTVTVTAQGFGTVKVDKVPVSAGVVYSLPLKLDVAQAAETVEVSAASLTLDTESTTQTTVLPNKTVQDTPLNGRDYTQLISVSPGYGGYSGNGFGSVNGSRANQVNWQIDGSDNNDLWHNIPAVNQSGVSGIAGVTLPIDSVEQFSQQTESSAEAGRNVGGTVNVVTKSGTNQIHGTAYYFNRNEFFAANNPFATPNADGRIVKNKLRNQQYGGSVGGPILRDKLFYFANFEKQQFIIQGPASITEPSLAYQAQAQQVLNQFGIPVNPVQLSVLNTVFPASVTGGPASTNNYSNASPETGYSYNGVVKLDWNINSKNSLAGRGYGGQGSQIAPVGSLVPYYFETAPIHVFNYSAVLNSTLNSRTTNQLVASVNYFNQIFYDQNHSFDMAALGLNTGVGTGLSGTPGITISGFDDLNDATPPSGRNDITGVIDDSVSLLLGKHNLRFGGEYRNAQVDEFYQRKQRGAFTYQGSQGPWASPENDPTNTAHTPSACEANFGVTNPGGTTPLYSDGPTLALADYLAGCTYTDGIVRGDTKRQVFVNTYSFYGQDAWQLSPILNINAGVRYDYLGPLHDGAEDLSVFRPDIPNLPVPGIAFQGAQVSSLYNPAHNNVSPRVGLSLKAGPSTVVRAGFGVFFDEPNLNPFLDNRPPNGGASGAESNPAGPNPAANIGQSFQIIPRDGSALFPATAAFNPSQSYNLFSVDPNFRSAYSYSYNFNVEQKLNPALLLTLGYVGGQGRKQLYISDVNQAAVGSTSLGTFAQNATRPYGAQFPYYGVINQITSGGSSNYNSLQVTLKSSNYHGLTSQFAYTWAHNLDVITQYRNTSPQNSFDPKGDYGNSDYDVRNTFVAFLNYSVPRLPGPHWLGAGWQLNSLLTFRGGTPYSIFTGVDSSGTGEGEDRADQAGPQIAGDRHIANHSGVLQYFTNGPDASPTFTTPTNAYGDARRNQFYGPTYNDVDFSVFKDGHIGERVSAQFRVEMFNLINTINLAPPNSTLSSGSAFGTVTQTIGFYNGAPGIGPGEPFNTQLALKIIF